jgi:hypothetical protein
MAQLTYRRISMSISVPSENMDAIAQRVVRKLSLAAMIVGVIEQLE